MIITSTQLGQAMTVSREGPNAIMDATLQPGASVPPHRHADQDERFSVLAGEAVIWIGPRRRRLTSGDSATVPHGSTHSVRNAGSEPLRLRAELHPGLNAEDFFSDLYALADGGHVTRRGLIDPHGALLLARNHGEQTPMLPIFPIALQRRLLRALHRPVPSK